MAFSAMVLEIKVGGQVELFLRVANLVHVAQVKETDCFFLLHESVDDVLSLVYQKLIGPQVDYALLKVRIPVVVSVAEPDYGVASEGFLYDFPRLLLDSGGRVRGGGQRDSVQKG